MMTVPCSDIDAPLSLFRICMCILQKEIGFTIAWALYLYVNFVHLFLFYHCVSVVLACLFCLHPLPGPITWLTLVSWGGERKDVIGIKLLVRGWRSPTKWQDANYKPLLMEFFSSNVFRILVGVGKLSETKMLKTKYPLLFLEIRILRAMWNYASPTSLEIWHWEEQSFTPPTVAVFILHDGKFSSNHSFGKSVIILLVFWQMSSVFCHVEVHMLNLW